MDFSAKRNNSIAECIVDLLHHIAPVENFGNHMDLVYASFALFATIIWYNYFWKPFNFFQDFTELGFEEVHKSGASDTSKKNSINELRQRRKIGDLPPVYPNGWFAILESDQLTKRSAKDVNVLGQNLVVWRGDSGQAYIADAYCPHLGAHLGVGGRVLGECIQCPFHNWEFDGNCNGKLTNIPYADSVPDFGSLKMWDSTEQNGFIFIWFHAENEKPTWDMETVQEIHSGSWSYRGRSEFRIACHIQEIPENGADVAHLNVLHKSAIMCGNNPNDSWYKWNFAEHIWSAKWAANENKEFRHEAILKVAHHIRLCNRFDVFHIDVDVHQLGPGIVMMFFSTIVGRGVLIQTVTPLEPMLQKVSHRFYSAKTFIHPIGRLILSGEAVQIARDIRIWNRKTYVNRPLLTKEDKLIKSFRRWFNQFYSDSSPRNYFAGNDANANRLDF